MRNLVVGFVFLALAAVTIGVLMVDRLGPRFGSAPGPSLEVDNIRNDENRVVVTLGRGEFDIGAQDVTDLPKKSEPTQKELEDQILGRTPSKNEQAIAVTVDPTTGRRAITVSSGDTLREISRKFLGDASRYNEILRLNPRMKRPEDLREGQVLILPPRLK